MFGVEKLSTMKDLSYHVFRGVMHKKAENGGGLGVMMRGLTVRVNGRFVNRPYGRGTI